MLQRNSLVLFVFFSSVLIGLAAMAAPAQTSSFTYQGKLTDGFSVAHGTYEMKFELYDAATAGNQIGSTLTFDGAGGNPAAIQVTSGAFTVQLDFGTAAFNTSQQRFLQVSVKKASESSFTTLTPRQEMTSAPFSVRSQVAGWADAAASAGDSDKLGGVTASNYLTTSGGAINGNLTLTGSLTASGVDVAGLITTTSDVLVGRDIMVPRNANIGGDITMFGTTYLRNWTAAGNGEVNGNFTTRGDARVTGTFIVDGPVYVGGAVNLSNNLTTSGDIAADDAALAGNLSVGGNATVAGNVTVTGVVSGDGSGLTNLPASRYQVVITSTFQTAVNKSYVIHRTSASELTLPETATAGDWIKIVGNEDSGFTVKQNSGQMIVTGVAVTGGLGTVVGEAPVGYWNNVRTNSSGSIVVAASAQYPGTGRIVRSANGGGTWSTIKGGEMWSLAMSADGTKIASTDNSTGFLYISSDSGQSWQTAPGFVFNVTAVAMTPNGMTIVGGSAGDTLYLSTDGGSTWTAKGPNAAYSDVAISSDGSRVLASTYENGLYLSTDGGNNFNAVSLSGFIQGIAMSADGSKAAAAVDGGGVFVSSDGGLTWTQGTAAGSFNSVAVSSSGSLIAASQWGAPVQVSNNGGVSFGSKGTVTNSYAVAVSGDGKVIYVAPADGALIKFANSGNTSTPGTAGALSGSAGASVELVYIGGGQWLAVNRTGTIVLL